MDIRLSILARDRQFSKAMQRIRPKFAPLFEAFTKLELTNTIYKAILVGITDEKNIPYFEEVPNNQGFFQVIAGCDMKISDQELTKEVYDILRNAAKTCPFSNVDHVRISTLFDNVESTIISEHR
jgi:hypothetical protein